MQFAQTIPVYAEGRSFDEMEELFYYLEKEDLQLVDSITIKTVLNSEIVAAIIEKDHFLFDEYPSLQLSIRALHCGCQIPVNIYKFKNLEVLRVIEAEFCNGLRNNEAMLSDSILNLVHLKKISFQSYSPFSLHDNLAKLPRLQEFHVGGVLNYPFSILTNKSIKSVGSYRSYPELEMFRQLGYKVNAPKDHFDDLIRDQKLPLIPSDQLKKKKLKEGKLELNYTNGNKLVRGEIKDKSLNGEWRLWYGDGTLCEVRHYDKGVPVGTWDFYERDGDSLYSVEYKNGTPYTLTIYDKRFDVDSRIQNNSRVTTNDFLVPEKAHRLWYAIRESDKYVEIKTGESIGGTILNSSETRKNLEGIVTYEKLFIKNIDGQPLFRETRFYENGQRKLELFTITVPEIRSNYRRMKTVYHGFYTEWDAEGNLILSQEYEFGVLKKLN